MKALQKIWTPARTIGVIALVGTLALGACSSSGAASSASTATSATAAVAAAGTNGDTTAPPTAADALASNAKASYVDDSDWKASDAVDVTLSGTTATSSSDAVSVSDGVLTISKAGVYKLSGSFTGKVVVAAGAEDQVVLILDNATIRRDLHRHRGRERRNLRRHGPDDHRLGHSQRDLRRVGRDHLQG